MESLGLSFSESERIEFVRHTRERRFSRNEVVFHEGDPGDALHVVDKGLFVARSSSTRGHVLTVNVFKPGSVFGELALLSPGSSRSATVASTVAGRTRTLRRADLEHLRTTSTGRVLMEFLLAVLVDRNRNLNAQIIELLFTPAAERVRNQLLQLDQLGFASDDDGWIMLGQGDLAMMTAVTRATVNRVLRDLEQRGIVELARGRTRIVDRARL